MRILLCAASAPLPPVNGHRLQLIHLCRELGRRHEVCVLAFRTRDQRGEPPAGVELLTIDPPPSSALRRAGTYLGSLIRRRPYRADRLGPTMRARAAELATARRFDVAHVSHTALATVVEGLPSTPAVLGARDAWHLNLAADALVASPPLRPLYHLEQLRVRRFESSALGRFGRVVVVSEEDARALKRLDGNIAVEVIPNGVDTERYRPDQSIEPEEGHLVFTGGMQWAPNVRAAEVLVRDVLPSIRAAHPRVSVSIVGRSPREEVRALAALEGVRVTGEVPDVRPWLNRAQVYVCPMVSGTGIKNKLLEALACGAPCVATPLACQGMRVRGGTELVIADGADAIAEAVAGLLDEPDRRARLGRAGREYVLKHHSWSAVAGAFERVYGEVRAAA